jgi:hypothetical protein|tara:strand:- start:3494 stop:3688 length:195 start_codon:yes stop_codon:yes gene_type:complete
MIKPVLMSKEIKFFVRDVYGNRFYYLVDSIDKWILELTGTKTLLLRDKQTLQDVGFKFVQVFED